MKIETARDKGYDFNVYLNSDDLSILHEAVTLMVTNTKDPDFKKRCKDVSLNLTRCGLELLNENNISLENNDITDYIQPAVDYILKKLDSDEPEDIGDINPA